MPKSTEKGRNHEDDDRVAARADDRIRLRKEVGLLEDRASD